MPSDYRTDMLDVSVIVWIIVIAVLNSLLMWGFIRSAVASAVKTEQRMKHTWAQTELLMAMARQLEVPEAELRVIADGLR